ncbi:DUF1831 domain-containing protein [Carnobacterium sp. CS13]|uniref:DUF1831 domain-containing protein n=1 Tax=Carnobacterium sp. CS13 TaxID=2800128 RepID=UPI001911FDDB|nr:DUF1831 domain-containing protein [Carnobacterium sp. CS13]QQP71018.1 DUF1831 domain-containing protein [Carnobacterium sp. CS13]
MAFAKTAKLQGSNEKYAVHPEVKRYTLRDNGFEETKTGNFQYIRALDVVPENKPGLKLKIIVSNDLTQLKISVTTSNGLQAVNIYKGNAFSEARERYEFIMRDFVEQGIVEKV